MSLNDLKPTFLRSVFSKLFEKILKSRILRFLNKNNILTSSQFGFRTNSSTELAITTLYDKLLNNLNEKRISFLLFLDLKKAFDFVSHSILLRKLYQNRFRGPSFNLLQSYLTNRSICTKVDGKLSKPYSIHCGIRQGSVLGPSLFLIFVSDLPNVSKFDTTLFADDTNFHLSHHNTIILQSRVEEEIKKIDYWVNSNQLTINYKKSCYMIIGKKAQVATDFKPFIDHNLIKQTDDIRYLGVYLNNKLSWKSHIKVPKICGIIYKLRHYVPLSTLKSVYFSLFHSQQQYSLLNWGRVTKTHLHKLEILQNKIIRACYLRPRFQHSVLLYSKLRVLELNDMIKMELAKSIFKSKNQMLPSSFKNYFINLNQVHKYNTKQKFWNEFYQFFVGSDSGKNSLQRICLNI